MEQETIFAATAGDLKGEIDLQWDAVKNASQYVVQLKAGVGENKKWRTIDIISESHYTVKGLRSNRNYAFRVAPVNDNKIGEWMTPVVKKAP